MSLPAHVVAERFRLGLKGTRSDGLGEPLHESGLYPAQEYRSAFVHYMYLKLPEPPLASPKTRRETTCETCDFLCSPPLGKSKRAWPLVGTCPTVGSLL